MEFIREEMIVIENKRISPCVQQSKVTLHGVSYKRLEFVKDSIILDTQWLLNGQFIDEGKEEILEKIYQKKESK